MLLELFGFLSDVIILFRCLGDEHFDLSFIVKVNGPARKLILYVTMDCLMDYEKQWNVMQTTTE